MALELVDAAAEAGADAVKFQTFRAESLITRTAPKAPYHTETTGPDEKQSWFELLKTQELTRDMHVAILERCAQRGVLFMSTPYDNDSVDLLDDLDIALYKVASTDANNTPFLEYMASKGRPIILSTAMCTLDEVTASVAAIRAAGVDDLLVMQCTGSYPAPVNEANLHAMTSIAEACTVAVGYSDHTPGMEAAIAATALGASAYEKHFTLDRNLPGPDHRASLEPGELIDLVRAVRTTEAALGDGVKRVMPCEEINRQRLRKSILAKRDIAAGEVISLDDLAIKRAGGLGLSPDRYSDVVGRRAGRTITLEHPITLEDLD
ncbi:MAG: N-acetylneuraminate synthase family protein [Rhodospirillales bacterium]